MIILSEGWASVLYPAHHLLTPSFHEHKHSDLNHGNHRVAIQQLELVKTASYIVTATLVPWALSALEDCG